ncbi:MAG: hypothetical protein IPK99_03050 [Flavobacteriales bacterium]|nr:hypothetical protein [Flavobacteriales bacterium]
MTGLAMLLAVGGQAQSWEVFDMNTADFPSNNVTDIAFDSQGRTWVSTDWGLCLKEGANWTIYQTQNSGLPDNRLLCLDVDSLDRIWIGTLLNGVLVYDGTTWLNFTTQNSPLPDDQIKCITIDHRGWAWIGTFLGLVCYTGNEWRIYDESTTSYNGLQLNGQVIEDVAVRPDGLVAIGTLNGGFHYLTDTSVAVHATYIDLFPDNTQLGVALDNVADERWMVTPSQGLLRQGGSWVGGPWFQYSTGTSSIPSNALISMAMDAQGRPWVGSMDKGLIVRDPNGTFLSYDTLNSGIPDNAVEVVKVASDGSIWVGTPFAGAARFDPSTPVFEAHNEAPAQLFPNPAQEHITLTWPLGVGGFDWRICDAVGQVVRSGRDPSGSGAMVDLSGVVAGTYVAYFRSADHWSATTFFKSRQVP